MTEQMPPPRLVLVTNRKSAKMALTELAARAVAGGVETVQLREKDLDENELRKLAIDVLEELGDPSRLMINGSPSIARELGIGLHLPDATADAVDLDGRQFVRLSRAVHAGSNLDLLAPYDFVIAGHIFETRSKSGLAPLGLDGLNEIVGISPRPVLAIGGVTPARVGPVLASGAYGVAVLSTINDSEDPESAANDFVTALKIGTPMQQLATISVQINGKPVQIAPNQTVMDYLKSRGHHERLVVVELNGQILAKAAFNSTVLSAGDRVEIVHFVGGG